MPYSAPSYFISILFPWQWLMHTCCWSQISIQVLWLGLGKEQHENLKSWKDPRSGAGEWKCFETYFERWFWNPKVQDNQSTEQNTGANMRTTILSQLCKYYHQDGPSLSSPWVAVGLHIRWLILWARISLKAKIPYLKISPLKVKRCSVSDW